ncbi:TPA: recombinase RecT, partial [Escherichia coli]|nr:recombinase RecT [Escherichia coli]
MSNIVEFVKQQEQLFCGALTEQTVTWAKESQFAIQYFQKNDYLAKTALANPTSAQNAIINVAAIGITLNPASKLAYLVPRDGMVCLDISYMGLLHIAMESGVISWGQAKLVHANDTYESNGLDKAPTHKYNAFGDRGDIVGVY